jgi:hypothetical protein
MTGDVGGRCDLSRDDGGASNRAARSVVCAALGQVGGLSAKDHGGEPDVVLCGREVVSDVDKMEHSHDSGWTVCCTVCVLTSHLSNVSLLHEENYGLSEPDTQRTSAALPRRDNH